MIASDQPTIFESLPLKVAFSSANDGSLAKGAGATDDTQHKQNLQNFLRTSGFSEPAVKLKVRYGDDKDYRTIRRVTSSDAGQAIDTDSFYTTDENLPLFLPVADCVATVVYDPNVHMLGILHLGRHSSVAHSIEAFCEFVAKDLGSKPTHWRVWFSPSLQQANNSLDYFEPESTDEWRDFTTHGNDGKLYIDIPAHNKRRFELLGVKPENIQVSQVNTYLDENYFSHRAANELSQPNRQGRMVVAAMLLPH